MTNIPFILLKILRGVPSARKSLQWSDFSEGTGEAPGARGGGQRPSTDRAKGRSR